MNAETIEAVMTHMQAIESDIDGMRRAIDAESLAASDRQYLARCFDLLNMEVEALRQYIGGLIT
jgi:hypothetical protein